MTSLTEVSRAESYRRTRKGRRSETHDRRILAALCRNKKLTCRQICEATKLVHQVATSRLKKIHIAGVIAVNGRIYDPLSDRNVVVYEKTGKMYDYDEVEAVYSAMLDRRIIVKPTIKEKIALQKMASSVGCTVPQLLRKIAEVLHNEFEAEKKLA